MENRENKTYQRIVLAAEQLFGERGYSGVTLQDIAKAVKMRHASLYYYVPNGKEELYIEVMERSFKKHGEGLTNSIIEAGDDFRQQIHAIATWFATQPPLDLGRIVRSDLPAIGDQNADRLINYSLETLRMPISAVIRNGVRKGLIQIDDVDFAAMGLVALLQSVHNVPPRFLNSSEALINAAKDAADMMLFGWYKR
jgi:AcrR family transcriptional regulator